MNELLRKLKFFGRKRFDGELEDEIQFHIESRADELEADGMPRADAMARARREFGQQSRLQEEVREAWQFGWLEDFTSDMRYAWRAIRRDPAFAATAILSLALGIGLNTTMFSLTMEFLFARASAKDPDALAYVRMGGRSHLDRPEFQFVKDANVVPQLTGYRLDTEANWRYGDSSYRLFGSQVADNFFDVIGVPVAMGRPLEAGDRDVVVISHRMWQRRLGGDSGIIGRSLVLDGRPHTVTGVLPEDHRSLFGFGLAPDFYMPVGDSDTTLAIYVRIPQGTTAEAVRGRFSTLGAEMDKVFPTEHSWTRGTVLEGATGMRRQGKFFLSVAAFFAMLMLIVGLLVLIACANVASLLLARASSRAQELAVRQCIGASRWRVVRQLLAESLLLSMGGTACGLALNVVLTGAINRLDLPLPIPMRVMIRPDERLLLYSSLLAIAIALAAGLLPALKATQSGPNALLKLAERQVGGRMMNLRNALVVGQLAVTIVVLSTAFLFVRNLMHTTSMSPGFDLDRTIWVNQRLVPEQTREPAKVYELINGGLAAVRALPGVESASVVEVVPMNDDRTRGASITTDLEAKAVHVPHHQNRVGPDYFRTMGIPLLAGREFRANDDLKSAPVAIVNQAFARRVFGSVNPVGHRVEFDRRSLEVVGVVANSIYMSLGEGERPAVFEPFARIAKPSGSVHLMVRSTGATEPLLRPVVQSLLAVNPSAAIEAKPMRQATTLVMLPSRVGAGLLGAMGALGLALASIGLYGVLVYSVSRRVREIGLRMALGANRGQVLRLVAGQAAWLIGLGSLIGTGVAVLVTRPLTMFMVPDVDPSDPLTYVLVIAVLLAVGLAATLGPALRAIRIDPMTALRYE